MLKYRIINSTVEDGNMSSKFGYHSEVAENRKNFFEKNNIKTSVSLKPLNTSKITVLSKIENDSDIEADCLITNKPDVLLYLGFGDCIPMVVYDRRQKIISLTHLGWESIVQNLQKEVINYYIKNFKSNISDLEVVLGPSIKKDSNIQKNPSQLQMPEWKNYIQDIGEDNYKVDLNKFVCDSLKSININNIINSDIDTASNPNYFSHHRYLYIDRSIPEGRFIYGVILDKED